MKAAISDPFMTSPNCSIKEVIDLTSKHKISGVPIVEVKPCWYSNFKKQKLLNKVSQKFPQL